MERCGVCGTALFEGISWCTQCLTPIAGTPDPGTFSDRAEPGRVVVVHEARRGSLVRGGSTTFGLLGKTLITVLLLALGGGAYLALDEWASRAGAPILALQLVLLACYALLVAIVLRSVWRVEPRRTVGLPDDRPPATHSTIAATRPRRVIEVDGPVMKRTDADLDR